MTHTHTELILHVLWRKGNGCRRAQSLFDWGENKRYKNGGEKIVFLDCLVEVESWRVLVGNKSFLIGPIKTQSPPNLGKNGAQIFGQNAHVTIQLHCFCIVHTTLFFSNNVQLHKSLHFMIDFFFFLFVFFFSIVQDWVFWSIFLFFKWAWFQF